MASALRSRIVRAAFESGWGAWTGHGAASVLQTHVRHPITSALLVHAPGTRGASHSSLLVSGTEVVRRQSGAKPRAEGSLDAPTLWRGVTGSGRGRGMPYLAALPTLVSPPSRRARPRAAVSDGRFRLRTEQRARTLWRAATGAPPDILTASATPISIIAKPLLPLSLHRRRGRAEVLAGVHAMVHVPRHARGKSGECMAWRAGVDGRRRGTDRAR
jgi:hypothetical protein